MDRWPGEHQLAAPPVELERSKSKQNQWGQSEGDIGTADSASVDRSGDERLWEGEHLKGAITVISPTLLRNIWQDARLEARHVIYAGRPDTTRKSTRQAVGLIQNQEDVDVSEIGHAEYVYSQHENSVGWVITPEKRQRSWDSDSSGDYVVMAIKSWKKTELKVAGTRLPI